MSTSRPSAPPARAARPAPGPAPEIAASINGSAESIVVRGWPAVLDVHVLNTQSTSFTIAAPGASWTVGLTFDLRAQPSNEPATWPFAPVAIPGGTPTSLAPAQNAQAQWTLSPDATTALATGTYVLRASFPAPTGAGWSGTARSVPVRIEVREPPSDPAAAFLDRAMLLASYHRARGDRDAERQAVRALVEARPDSALGHELLGDVLRLDEDWRGAFEAYSRALDLLPDQPSGAEPPTILLVKHGTMLARLPRVSK